MNFDSPEERDISMMKKMHEIHDKNMKEYGWYAHYVPGDDDSPTEFNAHTHGFNVTWNHPDVQIVIPMPQKILHGILITMADRLKEGKTYEPGHRYDGILHDFDVMFAWAQEGGRRVLRMILPDKKNKLERGEIAEPYAKQWIGTEE